MGTGFGPESYAIIEQGRIGQVLSSRPSDRRLILEEAAGISKFKTRKRLAEAKLESSRQNLARITDILEEVTKQVNSLKRQASKARRHKELHDELRGRLKVVLTSRWAALEAECDRLAAAATQAQEACGQASQHLEGLEEEQKAATQKHEEWEQQLMHLREQISQGGLERERLLARSEQIRQQAAGLDGRISDAAREVAEFQAQLTALEQQSQEKALQFEQVQEDGRAAQGALTQLIDRQDSLGAKVEAAEEEVDSCRQALLAAVSHAAELRNQLVQAEEAGLSLARQAARTESEKQRVEQENQRWAVELKESIASQEQDSTSLVELARTLRETAAALEQAKGEEASCRSSLEALRREVLRRSGAKAGPGGVTGPACLQHGERSPAAGRGNPHERAPVSSPRRARRLRGSLFRLRRSGGRLPQAGTGMRGCGRARASPFRHRAAARGGAGTVHVLRDPDPARTLRPRTSQPRLAGRARGGGAGAGPDQLSEVSGPEWRLGPTGAGQCLPG